MSMIGKYEVREKIGAGGFGVVYRAFDPHIRREVAIKTCSSDEDDIRRRFDNEARIAGNLQHRNITTVYDFGHHEDTPYLVQEYLSGEDLDRKIKRKENISFPEKLLYLIQICRGLAFAHDNGVIHRDIKPANIRILEDGTAKIMDFGIAKLAQQETRLTKTGLTVGTAAYLAPEQVTGDPIDPRTDIFSYGVLAFELLTYERPFPGPRISNVLLQIAQQPHIPLRNFWHECPDRAVELVDRCLEKKPSDRYDDCHSLLLDLDRLLEGSRQRREKQSPRPTQVVEISPATTRLEVSREQARTTQKNDWTPPKPASAPSVPLQERSTSASSESSQIASAPVNFATTPVLQQPPALPLEDMDLGIGGHSASAGRRSRQASRRPTGKPSPAPWILLGMLVVIVALVAGWQMGLQGIGSIPRTGNTTTSSPAEEPPSDTLALEAETTTAKPSTAAPSIPQSSSPAPSPEPEPPPPPAPGILVVSAGWDSRMTFEVAGQSHAMDRDRSLELTAGTYEVVFRFHSGDYRTRRTVTVRLEPGEQRSLQSPLKRPGALKIQARLGSPQGRVLVDGTDLGMSPIEKTLAPGAHRLEILGGSGPPQVVEVDVPSASKVMVTFDLRSASPPKIITIEG